MKKILLAVAPAALLAGCASERTTTAPTDQFLKNIAAYCGKAFAGQVVANEPHTAGPDPFAGRRLVMHVRGCAEPTRELRIPFHVGNDRSRTWILTRTAAGLQLKHDHRHRDGSEDPVTMYGGHTREGGTPVRQEFPVDPESVSLFRRQELTASVDNTWAMEIYPDRIFAYELTRPDGRRFRVEFDLSRPVEPPPAPWGYGS